VLGVVATDATFTGAEFQPLAASASSAKDQAAASTAVARVV
jgi:hypothetical protein